MDITSLECTSCGGSPGSHSSWSCSARIPRYEECVGGERDRRRGISGNVPGPEICIVGAVSHRLRRITLAAAVLPLLVLVGLRSAWASYACRIDLEVRTACCCPHDAKNAKSQQPSPSDGPHLQARCCCDVTLGAASVAPDARADHARPDDVPTTIVAAAHTTMVPVRSTSFVGWTGFARPPPRSNPIYLVNRAILL